MSSEFNVGVQLRVLRSSRGMSQRELAKRAGVTNGMISLIEQNRVSPSVGSLKKILDSIPVSLAEFFASASTQSASVRYPADEWVAVSVGSVERRLVGARRSHRAIGILRERYAAGADTGIDLLAHPGETGGVVLRGCLELTVGNEITQLSEGDGFYFSTSVPHRFRALGDHECEIISASTPPTY